MLLLPTRQPPKLLLRHTTKKPLEPPENLQPILAIQHLPLGPSNQLLNLEQTLLIQMQPQPLLHLLQHQPQEPLTIIALPTRRRKHLIHEPSRHQLLARNPLTHDKRLVGFRDAQTLHERPRRPALRYEAQRGEWREKEGVRCGVDEVREGDEGRGETDGGAIERGDEDL